MKNVFAIFPIGLLFVIFFIGLLLSGCGSKSSISTPFGDGTTESTGKNVNDAWAQVESKKASVIKDIEDTEQKRLDLEIAKANQVKVVLDSPEKIAAWNNAQATRDLGEVAKALAKGNNRGKYDAYFAPTPIPESEFAQGVKAVGGVITTTVNSPAALATGVGWAVGRVGIAGIKGAGDTASDNSTITKTTTTSTASGSGSTINNGTASSTAEKTGTTTEVSAAHWSECTTSAVGVPSVDEINGCMIGYGYPSTVCDGGICIDGVPYTGVK